MYGIIPLYFVNTAIKIGLTYTVTLKTLAILSNNPISQSQDGQTGFPT